MDMTQIPEPVAIVEDDIVEPEEIGPPMQTDPDETSSESGASSHASTTRAASSTHQTSASRSLSSQPTGRVSFTELDFPETTQQSQSGTDALFSAVAAEAKADEDAMSTPIAKPPTSPAKPPDNGRATSPIARSQLSPTPAGGESRSLIPSSSTDEFVKSRQALSLKSKDRMLNKDGSPGKRPAVEAAEKRGRGRPAKVVVPESDDETEFSAQNRKINKAAQSAALAPGMPEVRHFATPHLNCMLRKLTTFYPVGTIRSRFL